MLGVSPRGSATSLEGWDEGGRHPRGSRDGWGAPTGVRGGVVGVTQGWIWGPQISWGVPTGDPDLPRTPPCHPDDVRHATRVLLINPTRLINPRDVTHGTPQIRGGGLRGGCPQPHVTPGGGLGVTPPPLVSPHSVTGPAPRSGLLYLATTDVTAAERSHWLARGRAHGWARRGDSGDTGDTEGPWVSSGRCSGEFWWPWPSPSPPRTLPPTCWGRSSPASRTLPRCRSRSPWTAAASSGSTSRARGGSAGLRRCRPGPRGWRLPGSSCRRPNCAERSWEFWARNSPGCCPRPGESRCSRCSRPSPGPQEVPPPFCAWNPGALGVPSPALVPRRCHHPSVPGPEHFPPVPVPVLVPVRGRALGRGRSGSVCPHGRPDLCPSVPSFRHPPARGRRVLRGHHGKGQWHHPGGILGGSGHGAGRAAGHGAGRSRSGLGAGPGFVRPGPGPVGPQEPARYGIGPA